MDDMRRPCQHPRLDTVDSTQKATAAHNYAARHNPFVYFKSIISRPAYCKKRVVKLSALPHDLHRVKRTPNLAYITPDLCNDGHDAPCADGRPGGLKSVNAWMKKWVPRILRVARLQARRGPGDHGRRVRRGGRGLERLLRRGSVGQHARCRASPASAGARSARSSSRGS